MLLLCMALGLSEAKSSKLDDDESDVAILSLTSHLVRRVSPQVCTKIWHAKKKKKEKRATEIPAIAIDVAPPQQERGAHLTVRSGATAQLEPRVQEDDDAASAVEEDPPSCCTTLPREVTTVVMGDADAMPSRQIATADVKVRVRRSVEPHASPLASPSRPLVELWRV